MKTVSPQAPEEMFPIISHAYTTCIITIFLTPHLDPFPDNSPTTHSLMTIPSKGLNAHHLPILLRRAIWVRSSVLITQVIILSAQPLTLLLQSLNIPFLLRQLLL